MPRKNDFFRLANSVRDDLSLPLLIVFGEYLFIIKVLQHTTNPYKSLNEDMGESPLNKRKKQKKLFVP